MAIVLTEYGYLEGPQGYGEGSYLTGQMLGNLGMQVQAVVEQTAPVSSQSEGFIETTQAFNAQVLGQLQGVTSAYNQQVRGIIEDTEGLSNQVNAIAATTSAYSQQVKAIIDTGLKSLPMEARQDDYVHLLKGSYLNEGGYLEDPYLAAQYCVLFPNQVQAIITETFNLSMQVQGVIVDNLKDVNLQTLGVIEDEDNISMQVDAVASFLLNCQVLATLYNTTNLRILCDFPSRGTPAQGGTNWTANTTEPGDFSVNNLNTDIQEQVWRSATGVTTGIAIDCDTGLTQGVFMDTFAIINHNITTSATVRLLGSNDPSFTSTPFSEVLQVTDDNIYYISPDLPNIGYRYWRVSVDDATNTDGFILMGTIVFGAAQLFQGECFVDRIPFGLKDFADTVATEGFTNVANSRAIKRNISLEFRSLVFINRNMQLLRDLFKTRRTVLKCLWIPTPSPTDQEVTDRFAVFSKMATIPRESHNSKGPDNDYVDLTIDLDESL